MSDLGIIITIGVAAFGGFALYKAYKKGEFQYLISLIKRRSKEDKKEA